MRRVEIEVGSFRSVVFLSGMKALSGIDVTQKYEAAHRNVFNRRSRRCNVGRAHPALGERARYRTCT